MPEPEDVSRQDIEAALATRRELGLQYEKEVVDSFADRVEHAIQARVDWRLTQRMHDDALERRYAGQQLALGIVSLGTGIPITAITLGVNDGSILATAIAWAGIAAVNAAHALRGRGRRRG
jgi:hypothetical protein